MTIYISPDVAQELGGVVAERLDADGIQGPCALCGTRLSTARGDDASVALVRHLDQDKVVFLHHRCGESQIIYTGVNSSDDVSDDATYWGLILPSSRGPRPILLLQHEGSLQGYLSSGDRWNPLIGAFMDRGWTLLRTIGREPPMDDRWDAYYDEVSRAGRIVDADGEHLLDGLPKEEEWLALAAIRGSITVLVGDFEKAMKGELDIKELNALARAGELAATRMKFQKDPNPGNPLAAAARSVSSKLRIAQNTPARRPGERADARALLSINAEPVLVPVLAPGVTPGVGLFPLVLMDLSDPNSARAESEIIRLEKLGLERGPEPTGFHLFRNAPANWSALVWPSQLQMFVNSKKHPSGLVFFEQLKFADPTWYDRVKQHQGFGFLLGNNLGDPEKVDLDSLVRSRRVLAAKILAMSAV